ncbi:hypothetical protein [Rhizobium halophytocola]|uniref:Uncharacterized protein n=1 Tax=Rhizobium halophytocola TaxID=735519 RepID=A0ABS4E316_9HYPH|nr:hypothetical protein [Rhizobium halophytocola]MBP1852325.1 hypothetical protein [Rhizobium halophytocola]
MIDRAKAEPMSFAYCGGKDPGASALLLSRKKSGKSMSMAAKEASGGGKVAYGSLQLAGNVLNLTCERGFSGAARSMMQFLKAEKIPLSVKVIGAEAETEQQDDAAGGSAAPEQARRALVQQQKAALLGLQNLTRALKALDEPEARAQVPEITAFISSVAKKISVMPGSPREVAVLLNYIEKDDDIRILEADNGLGIQIGIRKSLGPPLKALAKSL